MYILKNAITSIVRNKGRNILMGCVILIIASAATVALAINNSSNELIAAYESKYEVEATIGMNRDNMMQGFDPKSSSGSISDMRDKFNSIESTTVEDVEKYADSEYVKSYSYTVEASVDSSNIEKATLEMPDNGNTGSGMPNMFGGGSMSDKSRGEDGDFKIKGYSSLESMNEFIEGRYKITDGEVFEDFDSNSCLINSELATLNDLSVGDTIKVYNPDNSSKTHKLVVSGIFEEESSSSDTTSFNPFSDSANTIIASSNFVVSMNEKDEDLKITVSPTFTLTSKDDVENFENELKDKGLSEYLKVETNLDEVKNATSTISNVKSFAVTFLVVVLIIGSVILLIINMINIRERRYEIGVLRTIGMKKSLVSLQFVSELFMVSLVALILGAGFGSLLSVPVSNNLLESEISSSEKASSNISENFGKGPGGMGMSGGNMPGNFDVSKISGVTTVQAYDSIDAVVDFKVLAELLGIGLLLTAISSISAVMSIQKFSPLTILKERS